MHKVLQDVLSAINGWMPIYNPHSPHSQSRLRHSHAVFSRCTSSNCCSIWLKSSDSFALAPSGIPGEPPDAAGAPAAPGGEVDSAFLPLGDFFALLFLNDIAQMLRSRDCHLTSVVYSLMQGQSSWQWVRVEASCVSCLNLARWHFKGAKCTVGSRDQH